MTDPNIKGISVYMRKLVYFIISSIMFLAIPISSAYAASVFTIGSTQYTNDGQTVQMDVAPYIEGNRTFLPLRYVANALGISDSNIYYNPTTHIVALYPKGNNVLSFTIGSTTMAIVTIPTKGGDVSDTETTMDVAPVILSGRTFLPVAWVAKAMGSAVTWDAASQTITLGDNSSSQQPTTPSSPATPSVTMTTFNVTPGAINAVVGIIAQLKVTATMSDGSTADITNAASYSSSNTSVAADSISPSPIGLVVCVAQGNATITVTDSGLSASVPVTVSAPAVQPTTNPPASVQSSTVNPPTITLPPTINQENQENQEAQIAIERQTEENIIATAQQSIANLKTDAQNQTNQIQNSDNPLIQTYNNQEQQQISQVDADDSARGVGSSVIAYDEQAVRNEYGSLIQGLQSDEQSTINNINQTLQNGINQQEQAIAQAQAALQQLNSGQ
jgi:hypothetical protein